MRSVIVLNQEFPNLNNRSNFVCRSCLTCLYSSHEISIESCASCQIDGGRFHRRYQSLDIIPHEALITQISFTDIRIKTDKLLSVLQRFREEVSENAKNLRKVADLINLKKKSLENFQQKVKKNLLELSSDLKNQLHLTDLDEKIRKQRIIKAIISEKSLKFNEILNITFIPEKILEGISSSSVKIRYNILDFFKEPVLNHLSHLSEDSILTQVRIYLNKVKKVKVSSLENKKMTWELGGSYIEYKEGTILYAAYLGIFSRGGVWSIQYSAGTDQRPWFTKIFTFPNVEFHSLEVFQQKLLLIGGNSSKIKILSLDNNEKSWKTICKIPGEIKKLGITHSVMINHVVHFVGNNSEFYCEFNVLNRTFKANFLGRGSKMIFCYNLTRFLFVGKEILVYEDDDIFKFNCLNLRELKNSRCPGKGKFVFPYIYFVAVDVFNNRKTFGVWRFSVVSYELQILNVRNF